MSEFNTLMIELESDNLGHWVRIIKRSGCDVVVSFLKDTELGINTEYSKWCKENCNDKYFVYNETYVFFKTVEDAMAFKLVWL